MQNARHSVSDRAEFMKTTHEMTTQQLVEEYVMESAGIGPGSPTATEGDAPLRYAEVCNELAKRHASSWIACGTLPEAPEPH